MERAIAGADDARNARVRLALVALLVAVPMLYAGAHGWIDYDGWWHVLIAREAPWEQFWRDVHRNAHPPLFFLLLRAVSHLGSERLVYRSISIGAAIAATYLVGDIAGRTLRTPRLALLCALAFGLAVSTAIMACAVRSYMLSLAFLLLAFRVSLDLIDVRRDRVAPAARIAFALAVVGAIASHYAAIFFAAAAVALPGVYAVVDRDYRRRLGERLRSQWPAEIATWLPIAAVIAAAYAVHLSRYGAPMPHLAAFHPDPAEQSAGIVRGGASFLARALVAEIDLFSPLPIAPWPTVVRALLVLLAGGIAVRLALRLRRRSDWPIAMAPLGTLVLLGSLLMAAAVAGRYPFGGFLRQQYILFPFLVLAAFALVDEIALRWRPRHLLIGLWAALMLNAVLQWRHVPLYPGEPGSDETAQFERLVPDSGAVYVDRFSLIPYFASHQRAAWEPQTPIGDAFLALPVSAPRRMLVLRDLTRWSADLSDPRLYGDLRALLQQTALPAIDVFRLRQDAYRLPPLPRVERAELTESIVRAAASQGVRVERVVLDALSVYLRVVPVEPPH